MVSKGGLRSEKERVGELRRVSRHTKANPLGRAEYCEGCGCQTGSPASLMPSIGLLGVVGRITGVKGTEPLIAGATHTWEHRSSWPRLGPVDKPDPETSASEQDEAEEAGCGLVIPGGNTPLFLEMTNEALDA